MKLRTKAKLKNIALNPTFFHLWHSNWDCKLMNQNIVALSLGVHRDHLHSHKIYQDGHKTRIYTLARNMRGRKNIGYTRAATF